jgi:hypothetical protein
MDLLTCHGRVATILDQGFEDWQLGISPREERTIIAQPDAALWLSALASVSGGLEDLAADAADDELLEQVRQGMRLFLSQIVSEEQIIAEANATLRAVNAFGEAAEARLAAHAAEN